MEERKWDRRIFRYLLMAAVLVLGIRYFEQILGAVSLIWQILGPLLLGAIIAFVLNLVMRQVERYYFPRSASPLVKKTRRPVSILLSLLVIAAAAVLIIQMVVPELAQAFKVIIEGLPAFWAKVEAFLIESTDQVPGLEAWITEQLSGLNFESIDWAKTAETILSYATSGVSSLVTSTISLVTVVVGGVVQFCISLIFAIYILANKERLASQGKRILQVYLKPKTVARIKYVLATVNDVFSSFIGGQCVEAVILGSLCAAGMWILRFPYAPMVGAFVGVTALIPIVGAYLGAAVGAFMILTINPWQAVLFVVFLVVLQQLEGNLIYPRVVGASIGLPGMWVLAAVTVGGGLGGIPGMLFGVPAMATLYRLLKNDVVKRQETKPAVPGEAAPEKPEAGEAEQE